VFTAREGKGAKTPRSRLGDGLPNAAVDNLTVARNGYIYAAAHAGGIWRIRLLKRGSGEVNVPIVCGGVLIEPGDVIVADGDGVLRIPLADAPRALSVAQARARRESEIRAAIAAGANMFEVVGLQAALDASDMMEIDGTWQQAAAGG
jgi:4-hydroxy-4-methyl-2-oxoglutarate aldolase